MEIYKVSFVGHRRIYQLRDIEDRMEELAIDLILNREYVEFYIGRNGDFDIFAASAIKRAQEKVGKHNSSLILVLPYHVRDEEYFEKYYDEVWLPIGSDTHFKMAITKRNEWMIDQSDLLVAYVNKTEGGAYQAMKYAEAKGIAVLNIAKEK